MTIAQPTPELSASPQILSGDLAAIAAQGFKTLIRNRPDGEGVISRAIRSWRPPPLLWA